MSSIGGMLGASGSGNGGTIPSAFINRQSTTDGEGQGDDQYDEYDEDPRRFDDATVRLFAAELMRLLQAITELFVRA
ncbi:hypothetical protein SLS57_012149 [Botryosphaeria dothidea]